MRLHVKKTLFHINETSLKREFVQVIIVLNTKATV